MLLYLSLTHALAKTLLPLHPTLSLLPHLTFPQLLVGRGPTAPAQRAQSDAVTARGFPLVSGLWLYWGQWFPRGR